MQSPVPSLFNRKPSDIAYSNICGPRIRAVYQRNPCDFHIEHPNANARVIKRIFVKVAGLYVVGS
jgi:hypothetical protein